MGRIGQDTNGPSSAILGGFYGVYRFTPAAGTRTYSVRFHGSGGSTITMQCGAGGANTLLPAFLRVKKAA
jgi:hypothetical protein